MRGMAIAAAALLAAALHGGMAAETDSVDVTAALRAADEWLLLIDRGAYGEGWERADRAIQDAMPRARWEVALEQLRGKLGGVDRRKLRAANYVRELPGAPPGEYVVIQYDTAFATRPLSVETVTPARQPDGSWKVSGYFLR